MPSGHVALEPVDADGPEGPGHGVVEAVADLPDRVVQHGGIHLARGWAPRRRGWATMMPCE